MQESDASTCFLNEQSRMAKSICDLVSNCFYDGRLVVAEDANCDPQWHSDRRLVDLPEVGSKSVHLEQIEEQGSWSQRYRGPIRYKSAERVRQLVGRIVQSTPESDILVLTPFRAQRTLVRSLLERAGLKRVNVSTVHRAQGSERHTVIFDPADGSSKFLQTDEARRLVNVALSRAKARLILCLSPGDRQNPLFEQVATVIEKAQATGTGLLISSLHALGGFPKNAVGKTVQINGCTGTVIDLVEGGRKFRFRDFASGRIKVFVTDVVLAAANAKGR
jgi:DNA replication ATP-dependent helicase Dna2